MIGFGGGTVNRRTKVAAQQTPACWADSATGYWFRPVFAPISPISKESSRWEPALMTAEPSPPAILSLRLRRLLRASVVLIVLAAIGAASSGFGYRLGLWPVMAGFASLCAAAFLAAIAVILGLVVFAIAVGALELRHAAAAVVAIVAGAAIAALPVSYFEAAKNAPRIHDITTDTEDPPQFMALAPLREAAPNGIAYGGAEIAAAQKSGYPDIAPAQFPNPPNQVFAAAMAVLQDKGMEIAASNPPSPSQPGLIEATATSFWFGFKDDVAIRIGPAPEGGTRLDIRSASRVGLSDIGANARRIRAFLRSVHTKLGT